MFDRPPVGEKTILVHVEFLSNASRYDETQEFTELAKAAGAHIVANIFSGRTNPEPKYLIGTGKAEEIKQLVTSTNAQLVILNHALTPAQERNLEQLLKCRVLDRYGLILDIFAQRARTFEGKLQVELALLEHLSTRLVRGWTHLERQKGGIGLRGPGETQLESDKRIIREKIKNINKRLEKVKRQRNQSRRTRQRAAIPTVALVGYTNAGKSSVFNYLSQADIYVANQLFATLDPTLRRINLAGGGSFILADTVGFISHLPHELIEAFSATLEETKDADLLLHVIDLHNDAKIHQIQQVENVLKQIEADHIPRINVFNKIDLLPEIPPHVENNAEGKPAAIWLSAQNGAGMELLLKAIHAHLFGEPIKRQICLTANESSLRAKLYALQAVQSETTDETGNWILSICLSKKDFEQLFAGRENLINFPADTSQNPP